MDAIWIAFIIECIVLQPVAIWVGWKLHEKKGIDYKQRWQESLALMDRLRSDGEIITKTVIKEKIVEIPKLSQNGEADKLILQQLHRMAGWQRQEAEGKRLKAGLPPVDDFQRLAGWQIQEMTERRYRYGYDELGRKFR